LLSPPITPEEAFAETAVVEVGVVEAVLWTDGLGVTLTTPELELAALLCLAFVCLRDPRRGLADRRVPSVTEERA
jgi:hypothetical protein